MSEVEGNSGGKGSERGRIIDFTSNTIATARQLLARGLGSLFGDRRNLYETFGYTPTFTYEQGLMRYRRLGIVSRIVNAYPDAVWARPPQLVSGEGASAAPGEIHKAIFELNKSLGLYHYVNRADRLAGLGPYSLLLLGLDDVRNNEDMAEPVRGNVGLAYLQAFGHGQCRIEEWEENPGDPHYGLPKIYGISVRGDIRGEDNHFWEERSRVFLRVHRDRVIHIVDSPLDDDVYGYPILERIYNCLDDTEKVVGGSAEMFWLNGRGGLHIDVDKETQFTEANGRELKKQLDEFMHDLTRVLRTRGVSVNKISHDVANPEPVFNVVMSMVSIATGIPQRIFIGSEQGKLASEQDRANWAIRINERRTLQAEPKLFRPLVVRLQRFGIVPKGEFSLQWPEAFQMSPLERSQTAAQQARSATNVVRAMRDYRKPIEGVDYPISRPGQTVAVGGGGGGRFNAANTNSKPDEKGKEAGKEVGKKGDENAAPEPKVIPNQEIQVKMEEFLSREEGRQIVFARGELKSEGSIDGIPD